MVWTFSCFRSVVELLPSFTVVRSRDSGTFQAGKTSHSLGREETRCSSLAPLPDQEELEETTTAGNSNPDLDSQRTMSFATIEKMADRRKNTTLDQINIADDFGRPSGPPPRYKADRSAAPMSSWYSVRGWGKRAWAIVGASVVVLIIIIIAVAVTVKKKSRYPDYSKLTYTLSETCSLPIAIPNKANNPRRRRILLLLQLRLFHGLRSYLRPRALRPLRNGQPIQPHLRLCLLRRSPRRHVRHQLHSPKRIHRPLLRARHLQEAIRPQHPLHLRRQALPAGLRDLACIVAYGSE